MKNLKYGQNDERHVNFYGDNVDFQYDVFHGFLYVIS